jgi:hypothetical protein
MKRITSNLFLLALSGAALGVSGLAQASKWVSIGRTAMRTAGLCAVVSLLAACTTVSEVKGPDSRPAYVLNCGANEANCYTKATEICPKGYSLVSSKAGSVVVPLATGGSVGTPQYSLVIECNDQGDSH